MPRTSRHKSSKHSSRESRDYSDSEKDSNLKDRNLKEESVSIRASKEMTSGEKRNMDSKTIDSPDLVDSGSAEHVSLSKKRKEKAQDDRWTAGVDEEREVPKTEGNMKDSKGSGEPKSKSSRREEKLVVGVDPEEGGGKRSGSKGEQKHHRSSDRKDKSEKEVGSERERKGKDVSRSERLVDIDGGIAIMGNERSRKAGFGDENLAKNVSGFSVRDELRKPEDERELERRVRRKRDSSGDGDKHHDTAREIDDRRVASRDDAAKSGRSKDEVHKDKCMEDVDKDGRHQEEKQRDGRHVRDYTTSRSDDKYLRNEKRDWDTQEKKSRPVEYDTDRSRHDHDYERDGRDNDLDREQERDRERGHDRGRDLDRDREREHDHDHDHRYRRERERGHFRDRDLVYERSRDWEHDDHDYSSHVGGRSSRYKEDRRRRRSLDDYDDYYNDKSRSAKREGDAERERARKAHPHPDAIMSSSRRVSPSSKTHITIDKFRDAVPEDAKYGDSVEELASISETRGRSSKYQPIDKRAKFDDNHVGDSSAEKSPGAKASPMGVMERSPSSTSIDRKYVNRTGRRPSLDVDEAERRSSGSNDVRDGSVNEDRQTRDFSSKKSLGEEVFQAESMSYHRSGQRNVSSHVPGPPSFRNGADSPSFMGSMGEEGRAHSTSRYRRSVDPNIGRVHGNPWKAVPNWHSPLPNGFMPFPPVPHGPPHGGFPGLIPQYPSPPIFGVRPSLEMNHPGIPYMSDPDRFPNHVRPLGWQNMVDGSGPSHFHGWDSNNDVLRDDSSIYGMGHQSNGQARDTNLDAWKQSSDINSGEHSGSWKDGPSKDGHIMKASTDEACAMQDAQGSYCDNDYSEDQGAKTSYESSPAKEALIFPNKVTAEKTREASPEDDAAHSLRVYLSKLDISIELLPPVLYSQCKSLAVEEQSEDMYDLITQPAPFEEYDSTVLEVSGPITGITLLPAAVDSAFQRAVDLYRTQGMKRFAQRSDGKNLHVLSASEGEGEKETLVQEVEGNENNSICKSDQEIQEQSVLAAGLSTGPFPITSLKELEVPVSTLNFEALDDHSNPLGLKVLTVDLGNSGGTALVPAGDKMDGGSVMEVRDSEEPSPKNLAEGNCSSPEIVPQNVTINDTAQSNMNVGENWCSKPSSCAEPQELGGTVSGSLILPHGPVNNCEALMSVSNESESVILSRIHPAPESTH
ncbi:hypothetical protein Ancab_009096 [Ancistrocladus abbreviatus]